MLEQIGQAAKQASYHLASLSADRKQRLLMRLAQSLEEHSSEILRANQADIEQASAAGASAALLDRLLLTPERLRAIAEDIRAICQLPDPIGQIIDDNVMASGLRLVRRCVPLGVIGAIYEARPNVTIDIAALCLKTGNAAILRGGKETRQTNLVLVNMIQQALMAEQLPVESIQLINDPDRALIYQLLKLERYVDMIIPRGGAALQQLCKEHATIPVITGGIGVCHMFVDETAEAIPALKLIENAKTQRPSTCNTLETLLVHQNIAQTFLPLLGECMAAHNVTLHASPRAYPLLVNYSKALYPIKEEAYSREWLSLDLNVAIVDSIDDAIAHIRHYGSAHSEAILTRSMQNAHYFVDQVDAAAVYVNASTRFTDGAQFGLGAEVAVSTQKLHARGPMGLQALTTYKWIGYGDDLIRS